MKTYAQRVYVRDRVWRVQTVTELSDKRWFYTLLDPNGGETLEVLSPPEEVEILPEEPPVFSSNSLSPWQPWLIAHQAIKQVKPLDGNSFAAFFSGRISPEPYQFAPVNKMLQLPRPRLLIADDVGLGKTIEAGICMMELIARGRGKRILLIVPPGLIPQWQDEMFEKFGLYFQEIENAASLERVQTNLSKGIKPWVFLDRVITSIEYIKKKEIVNNALKLPWDIIVIDEAHYLSESGTSRNPFATARTRLGREIRDACQGLLLLTATPHNGYSHSFRSLLELIEPTDATFAGDQKVIQRRVSRNMIRRLKPQIYKTDKKGEKIPAFPPREPVNPVAVYNLSSQEQAIFKKVSAYCAKTAGDATGAEDSELVSFAMQIIKKRMLSSRAALFSTINNRLDSLKSRSQQDEPPPRADVKELQGDLPLSETQHERIASRIVRSSIPKEVKRRNAEKKQLQTIIKLIKKVENSPDPKIEALMKNLKSDVLSVENEKAIIFTEYRDTLNAIKDSLTGNPELKNTFVELTGGLTAKKRQSRLAEFEKPEIRLLLATDAASEGLNLQFHCRRLYHMELPWNPNRMEQRNGRIDRHGQKRSPVIRYFYYPDSPEDKILNRLMKKILEMQEDRVSTPDILGILSGSKIEEVLTGVNSEEKDAGKSQSLFKLIDNNRKEFNINVAPIISTDEAVYGKKVDLQSLSADPVLEDNLEFETFILKRLGKNIEKNIISHTYSISTPPELKGPGVKDSYPCITMRRSLAIIYPARDVEYLTPMHPLFHTILDESYKKLSASHTPQLPPRRIAVRQHEIAKDKPFVIFTFAAKSSKNFLELIPVAVNSKGDVLGESYSQLALDDKQPPGEVKWTDVSNEFEQNFQSYKRKPVRELWRY